MKKFLTFAVITAMLAAVSCSDGKNDNQNSETAAGISEIKQTIYKEEKLRFDISIDEPFSVKMCENNCLFFYKSRNAETKIQELRLAVLDLDFNVKNDILLSETVYPDFTINVNNDGSFDIAYLDTDFEFEYDEYGNMTNWIAFTSDDDFKIMIANYSSSAELISENELIGLDKEYDNGSSRFSGLCPYGEGKQILSYGNGAAIIGEDGSIFDTAHYEMQLVDLGCDSDGKVIASSYGSFGYMDGETLNLPDKFINYNEMICLESNAVAGDGGLKAYFQKQDGIYGLTPDGELVLVFDFADSLVQNCSFFDSCGDGVFVAGDVNANFLCKYTRQPDDFVNERETVNIWYISGGDNGQRAIDFSKANDKFLGKVAPDLKTPQQLTEAILTGSAPDVVEICDTSVLNNLINLGAAADMRELMDEYGGFSFDDLMPNVVQAFDRDGKIYALPYTFCVQSLAASRDYIGSENVDWTYEDMYKFFDERPDGMVLFNDCYTYVAGPLISENLAAWVDTKNKTCNFDSPEFIKFLEFCKDTYDSNLPQPDQTEESRLEYEKLRYTALPEHKTMLSADDLNNSGLTSYLESIGAQSLDFDSATLLNMPDSDGVGKMCAQNSIVVMETSGCKEGAWAYVTYMLTDYQFDLCDSLNGQRSINFTNKEAFEKSFKTSIFTDGEPKMSSMHYCNANFTVDFPIQITQKQADEYLEFVMNCTELEYENYDVSSIIYEEFDSYLNGEITAEQCAERIQNRAELVLSESR